MKKFLICGVALLALLAVPAVAQQYPSTARNTNGQVNVVLPTAAICTGGVPCPAQPSTINLPVRITVSASAAVFPTQAFVNGIIITALTTNVGSVCLGNTSAVTTSNGYCLVPGQSIAYGVTTSAGIYDIGTNAGDGLEFTGN